MSSVPPPPPSHLLRSHSAPLSSLFFSDDNERLYSGDATGLVVITSTRSLRAIASWKAHTDGLLGLEEWGDQIITFVSPSRPFQMIPVSYELTSYSDLHSAMEEITNYTFGIDLKTLQIHLRSISVAQQLYQDFQHRHFATRWM